LAIAEGLLISEGKVSCMKVFYARGNTLRRIWV